MSVFVTKASHVVAALKKVLSEQLWLFGLLAPLVMLAVLGAMHWRADTSKHSRSEEEPLVQMMTSAEITSAEVALIVAKPIGELLEMQVYFAEKSSRRSGELLAELKVEDVYANGASNQIVTYANRRIAPQVLTYSVRLDDKKNPKMAGQS